MFKSTVVEVDGVFVGAAILQPDQVARAFFATHERVRSLHGLILPDLAAVHDQARGLFRKGDHAPAPQHASEFPCS